MSFEVSIDQMEGVPVFRARGPVTTPNCLSLAEEINVHIQEKQIKGVVVDCAGMQGALDVGELFYMTQEFIRIVGIGVKVAYINPPSSWIPQDDEFSRNVARNRGGMLELFLDVSEAIAWLKD